MEGEELAAFERAVIAQAPPGSVVVGASLSPDGAYGTSLTFLPSANYLMDDLFVRREDGWELHGGGSGGGVSWSSLDGDEQGVLRYGDEAPNEATTVRVRYEETEYRVPARHGHFLFVAWDTHSPREMPTVVAFE